MTRPFVPKCIVAVVGLFATLLCSPQPSYALDILLTNDDGIEAQGILVLRELLLGEGHDVSVVAPDSNRSGSGASLTIGPVSIEQRLIGVAVSSTPATAVLLTGKIKPGKKFDLVVSGINHGANVGYVTPVSGTVGAALIAASSLGLGVPSIAISTDLPDQDSGAAAVRAQLKKAGAFLAQIISSLERDVVKGAPLLPPGVALNANFPLAEKVLGVQVCRQGLTGTISITYERDKDGIFLPKVSHSGAEGEAGEGTDTQAFKAGYATIVPIVPDYSAPRSLRRKVAERLEQLTHLRD